MKPKKKAGYASAWTCLAIVIGLFTYMGIKMGAANMLNTIMHTAHDLLLNTVFYLMGICVITGALGKLFVEFGVVDLIEKVLRPMMKPLFNLPGVASLGAVMTFLSDNPAIITLSKDKRFASYFKKYQYISLTNFGTAFGMGLIVIIFMISQGYFLEPLIGLFGAFVGCIVTTRLMQHFVIKAYPSYKDEEVVSDDELEALNSEPEHVEEKGAFLRTLNALLDGGKNGVEVGLAIIPGVLIISTLVMVLTFGPDATGAYTGAAYQGTELLPWLANKVDWLFKGLFGFNDPHQIAFPITALGAVGAALSLIPNFAAQGWLDGNAIAVFTAIGMCWSGFLSTHTAMLDSLGYRELTGKAILSHTIGGLVAAITAHLAILLISITI
ncbi:MAG: nucleoside recognition domain-containing protein [Bacteroidales bacterium]|nr:nucleoside recognition domain-containing protein [Bacteroidales bacterium]